MRFLKIIILFYLKYLSFFFTMTLTCLLWPHTLCSGHSQVSLLQPLSWVPLCRLPCNQRPLFLNYRVWIWAPAWPSLSDPTTDPLIRQHPPLYCLVCCITFFFHSGDLYEDRYERRRVTLVVFSHPLTSQALNRGLMFTLIVHRLPPEVKGCRAGSITPL